MCWASRLSSQIMLPAFAAKRGRLQVWSIAGTHRPRPHSAANQPHAAAAVNRRDRQTDRRTDIQPIHRPCSAYYRPLRIESINKCMTLYRLISVLWIVHVFMFTYSVAVRRWRCTAVISTQSLNHASLLLLSPPGFTTTQTQQHR